MATAADSHPPGDDNGRRHLENRFAAQLLRDATMAESLSETREKYPHATIVHITGAFHSDFRLGTVEVFQARQPASRVVVFSPVIHGGSPRPDDDGIFGRGDYLYFLKPLPSPYIGEEKRARHWEELKARANAWTCPLS